MTPLRVWDLPTRIFHWLFALAFAVAWTLGGEDDWLGWHSYFGYLAGGLIVFRLFWGFFGEELSRFRSFPIDPAGALRYLKNLPTNSGQHYLGHNPAGALAIYALLALGLATAVSGMALLGADKHLGPLAGLVASDWEDALEEVHEFCANAMLLVVFGHLAGVIAGSLLHRENLPRAMVTGFKPADISPQTPQPARLRAGVAAALLLAIAVFTASHDFSGGCDDNPTACENDEQAEDEEEARDDDRRHGKRKGRHDDD